MSTFLPKEVQDGLNAARRRDQRRKSRMMVEGNGQTYRILKFWDGGFSVERAQADQLRGFVDIYDRGHHLYQALIVAAYEEDGLMLYDFKRMSKVSDQPPRDFVEAPVEIKGLLGHRVTR